MGITLFASGKIDTIEDIPRLIEYVKEIAEERGWKYRVIEDDFDTRPNASLAQIDSDTPGVVIKGTLGLKGVVLNVGAGAEPLQLLFDQNGILTGMPQQLFWIEDQGKSERCTMCKTQFAHIDGHIEMVELLSMLKGRYLSNLAVNDEGGYWESRDKKTLAEKRIFLDQCIRHTEKAIGSIDISEEDRKDPGRIASCIEDALQKDDKKGGGETC